MGWIGMTMEFEENKSFYYCRRGHEVDENSPLFLSLSLSLLYAHALRPCPQIGMIIGKGGSTYKHFTETSGCGMDIPKMATPGTDYREVSLYGLPAQVRQLRHDFWTIFSRNFDISSSARYHPTHAM